jgi:hypothetical protein
MENKGSILAMVLANLVIGGTLVLILIYFYQVLFTDVL